MIAPLDRRRERWVLLLLTAVQFTHVLDFMILMPLGPQFMRMFAIGPTQFGFLVSVYTFSSALVGFAAAFFIDRFDRKKALLERLKSRKNAEEEPADDGAAAGEDDKQSVMERLKAKKLEREKSKLENGTADSGADDAAAAKKEALRQKLLERKAAEKTE